MGEAASSDEKFEREPKRREQRKYGEAAWETMTMER